MPSFCGDSDKLLFSLTGGMWLRCELALQRLLSVCNLPLLLNANRKGCTVALFADDTSLLVTDINLDNLDSKLSANLRTVYKWFK
jgi:hypothetical protein